MIGWDYITDCGGILFWRIDKKYNGKEDSDVGDAQFEIDDSRSFEQMMHDMKEEALQPVLNEYLYV